MIRYRNLPVNSHLARYTQALARLNVYAAWQHTTGNPLLPVAVLGANTFDATHAEFSGKTTVETIVPAAGPSEDQATVAAAALAGVGGSTGMYGVAYGSPLVYLRTFAYESGEGYQGYTAADSVIAQAISRARTLGARVSVIPNGDAFGGSFPLTASAISSASDALLVASAGDEPSNGAFSTTVHSPAELAGVLSVGGVLPTDEASGSLNPLNTQTGVYGSGIHLAAPKSAGLLARYLRSANPNGFGQWGQGSGVAASFVAGIAQLMLSVNPSLTGAQVRSLLLSTADRSRAGWLFSAYFSGANVGIADAERAVLASKASGSSGTVFPFLRLHGLGRPYPSDSYGTAYADQAVRHVVANGECRVLVNGTVGAEIGGYCYVGGVEKPATNVQLWLDGAKVYDGAPTSRAAGNLFQFTSYRNDYYDVRVIASTATGETATRTYLADYDANPATTYAVASYVTDPSLEPVVDTIASPTSADPIIISGRVPSFLEGGASGSAAASGNLSIPVVLQGSAAGSATASADLSTPARLVGSATGIASASGDLTASVVLEPTAEPHVNAITSPTSDDPIVVSGLVPPWAVLEGGALGTGEATGDLVSLTLGGDATADSDAAADLTAQAVHALSGDAVASSSAALASGTHTYPVVDVLLSAAERTVYLHHGRVDVVLSASERTVILERRAAA